MAVSSTPALNDTPELQDVLTRYVDSRDGYLQASQLIPVPALAKAFAAIADRRQAIAIRMAGIIAGQGATADTGGSPEAGLHRWWIRLRDQLTDQETDAILAECVRGEKELARTLESALESGALQPGHAELLQDALDEVKLAIHGFEAAAVES